MPCTHLEDEMGDADQPAWEGAVPFTLTLDLDFASISSPEEYKTEFIKDIAFASNTAEVFFKFAGLRAGSIINEMVVARGGGNPDHIIQDLIKQLGDPNSCLMQGKWTRKCIAIDPATKLGGSVLSDPSLVVGQVKSAHDKDEAPEVSRIQNAKGPEKDHGMEKDLVPPDSSNYSPDSVRAAKALMHESSSAALANLEKEVAEAQRRLKEERAANGSLKKEALHKLHTDIEQLEEVVAQTQSQLEEERAAKEDALSQFASSSDTGLSAEHNRSISPHDESLPQIAAEREQETAARTLEQAFQSQIDPVQAGLVVGGRVEIHSLLAAARAPELNGVHGEIVVPLDSSTGRCGVKTDTDGRVWSLRPDNLRRLEAHGHASPASPGLTRIAGTAYAARSPDELR